jgi:hypothetical protein
VVVERLAPCDQGEGGEGLRLEFESKVEVLDNRVDTKWHAAFVVFLGQLSSSYLGRG